MFPNPADSYIQLQAPGNQEFEAVLQDLKGQVVFRRHFKSAENSFLDLTGLKDGIYVLQVTTANENLFRKIIKN